MTEQTEVSELLGYEILTGLTSPNGEILEPVKVPVLPSNISMRYYKRIKNLYTGLIDYMTEHREEFKAEKDPNSPEMIAWGKFMMEIFDSDESVSLQLELTAKTFGISEDELGRRFSFDALNKVYASIFKQNFGSVFDALAKFQERFVIIFGAGSGDAANPPMTTSEESTTGT